MLKLLINHGLAV